MRLQVLVSTMNQTGDSLIERMNIQSDALIINQTNHHDYREITKEGHTIHLYSFAERGIGLSRNSALMRTDADIALLADDDLIYWDGYQGLVERAFSENPDADLIIFNLEEEKPTRFITQKKFRVSYRNYMRFGAARLAFRPQSIHRKGISFHLLFGGGTRFSNGEDTIFLRDCLKKGLKIVAVPVTIATLTEERESTWFEGYTEKYYRDRGALFKTLSPFWFRLLIIQFVLRKYKSNQGMPTRTEQIQFMLQGAKQI